MKVKYYEWKCVGCEETRRFTDENAFSAMPYWFTIRTEGCVSSGERPSFNTSACSISCLEKSSKIIEDSITKGKFSIPNKKEIHATICDQCAKVAKLDKLNPIIGSKPHQNWTWVKTPAGRKDFCSTECQTNHSTHPEEAVFFNLNFNDPLRKASLINAIDLEDLREKIKTLTSC